MESSVVKICINPDCEEEVLPARYALGYRTCIYCGSPDKVRTVGIAYNKGAYQLISLDDIESVGK